HADRPTLDTRQPRGTAGVRCGSCRDRAHLVVSLPDPRGSALRARSGFLRDAVDRPSLAWPAFRLATPRRRMKIMRPITRILTVALAGVLAFAQTAAAFCGFY